MKLKLVVASMSILGLVSCPVFAGHTKHHKHHKMKQVQTVNHPDYKDMGMPVQPAPVEICTISNSTLAMDMMTQNMGRALPNPCNPGWFNRIQLSGGVNVDAFKFGNRNANIMGENYQRLSLNDAYLNLAANVNDWAKAFMSISFSNPTTNANPSEFKNLGAAEYNAAYTNNINSGQANIVQVEQAYATIGNPDMSPIFLQLGKQFQDFSRYEIHAITESMTQVMSKTLATSLKIGFMVNGFHGALYGFDDPLNKNGNSSKPTNYGIALGYDQINDCFGWDIGAAYLYNLIGANDVAYSVVNFTGTGSYHNRVGAYALYGDVNSGPFTLGARWTAAVQRFSTLDLTKNGFADLAAGSAIIGSGTQVTPTPGASGAKPWALGLQAGYGFNYWDKAQNIYLGYQASHEAAGLNLPKSRWLLGWGMDLWKSTIVGIEWDHDMAYGAGNGGTGNNTNLVSVRAGVKFS